MKNYIKRATVILSLVMAMSVPVNVHSEEYSGEPTEEGVYIAITKTHRLRWSTPTQT